MDVEAGVAGIALIGAAMTAIGAAKLGPAAIVVGFKWAKAAIFG